MNLPSPPTSQPPPVLTESRMMSVNQLKSWRRCQRKYMLDYEHRLRWPSNPRNFQLGQDVHKLLDYQARGLALEGLIAAAPANVQRTWQTLIADCALVSAPILGSEWGFTVPVPEVPHTWLEGRMDRIARVGERIAVIDWKTGTSIPRDPETDWQTVAYLYAAYEARTALGLPASLPPEAFEFVYVEVRDRVREVRIPYSQSLHAAHRGQLIHTVQAIVGATEYPLPETCPDRYCPYPSVCGIQNR